MKLCKVLYLLGIVSVCGAMHLTAYAQPEETEAVSDSAETDFIIVDSPQELTALVQENLEGMDTEENVSMFSLDEENYESMRIVVYAENLETTYDAAMAIYYPAYDEYVLQFDTQAQTKEVYEQLLDEIPQDQVYVDQILDESFLMEADASQYQSWGTEFIGASEYLNGTEALFDDTVTVAYIDTGVDWDNPWFEGRTMSEASYNFGADESAGESTSDVTDTMGHGTAVAGILCADTPSNVQLMVLKIYNSSQKTSWLVVNTALQYAILNGADVVNMSLGLQKNPADGEPTYKTYVDDAVADAYSKNIPIICSAGNGYKGNPTDVYYVYPACLSQTIAISAIDSEGEYDGNYSNYGEGIDFCAPGTSIRTAGLSGQTTSMSGTSMAAPCAAAVMCWYKLLYPEAGISELMSIAGAYAMDLGETGRDIYYGRGCMSVRLPSVQNPDITLSLADNVYMTWNAMDYAQGYSIYMQKGQEETLLADLTVPYYKMQQTEETENCTYRIYAYAVTPTGVRLNGIGTQDTKAQIVEQVSSLKAQLIGDGQVKISFKGIEDADRYAIYVQRGGSGKKTRLAVITDTSYVDTQALKNEKNYYWVYAYKVLPHYGTIKGDSPAYVKSYGSLLPVTKLKAEATGKKTIKISWNGRDGVVGYAVYTQKNGKKQHLANVTSGTQYIDKDTVKGVKNYYWVYPYIKDASGKIIKGTCTSYVYAIGL